jgi:phage gp29-like protein
MSKLYSEYLKRESTFLGMIGDILPDPDKVLETNGNDIQVYKDLLVDPHLTATILQRKMQVLQMGWEIICDDEKMRKEGVEIMQNIPMQIVGSQILDSILYGFNVCEIIWFRSAPKKGATPNRFDKDRIVPKEIVSKPQEWFVFDKDNELKITQGRNKRGELIDLPKYKFLVSQHKPTYDNPYGEKILQKCFWPVKLKQSTVESWVDLIEKFGVPYLIGVVSDTATEAEKEEVIENLLEMIDSNVATRGTSETIEIKEQTSYDVGALFERMSEFQNKEISKAVLSVTLTVDVGTSGSYKASDVHRAMLEYIGISDKKIVEQTLNEMFEYYTELNYGKNSPRITVKLTKKEKITEETANRDKMLSEIGVVFTKEYFMKKYNLNDEDFELGERIDVKGEKEKEQKQ